VLEGLVSRVKALLTHHNPVVAERRKLIRMSCRLMLEVRVEDGPAIQAVASDLSLSGLRLETRVGFKRNQEIMTILPGSQKMGVRCCVVWSKKLGRAETYSTGLLFDETDEVMSKSWVKEMLRQVGFGDGRIRERRSHVRVPSHLRCALANRSGDVLTDGTLLNIGLGGALVGVHVEVNAGTILRLQVDPVAGYPALDLMAEVRSSRKDVRNQRFLHGLRFQNQQDPLVVRYLGVLLKLS